MGKNLKGKELGEGLCQRKDGRYQARYTDKQGKRKTIIGKELDEVRSKLYEVQYKQALIKQEVVEEYTLDEWFTFWMQNYKVGSVRETTLRLYYNVYKIHISPIIGDMKIREITRLSIQQALDGMIDRGCKQSTQRLAKQTIMDMLHRAEEDGFIQKVPTGKIVMRAEEGEGKTALTKEQTEQFLKAAEGTNYENLYHVALNTGMRPGELFALTPDDIDFDSGIISVNKTLTYGKALGDEETKFIVNPPKTKSSYRKVPMNAECKEYIKRQIKLKEFLKNKYPDRENEFIFVTRANTPINRSSYNNAIHTICEKMGDGFPKVTGHALRHTFATRCFEHGVPPKVVQGYLGHTSLSMTMDVYTHLTNDIFKSEIENIIDTRKSDKVIDFQKLVSNGVKRSPRNAVNKRFSEIFDNSIT